MLRGGMRISSGTRPIRSTPYPSRWICKTGDAMTSSAYHVPVLADESLGYLVHDPAGLYVDGTLGGGGHTRLLLERFAYARVIGVDADADALGHTAQLQQEYPGRFTAIHGNFGCLDEILSRIGSPMIAGILLDLGVSSHQLDEADRGFSFLSPNLDMRMDADSGSSAEDLVNSLQAEELADIIFTLGEERRSRRIAAAIVAARSRGRIRSGRDLAEIIARVVPRTGRINPATRTFQALRIAVNREMDRLARAMEILPAVLDPGGRAVVISYHSLEDRIVKHAFRNADRAGELEILTRSVITPGDQECRDNPRARSARLRAARRISA
jgi:16S rRNA (cytosine1402-N4)-methyltransferase